MKKMILTIVLALLLGGCAGDDGAEEATDAGTAAEESSGEGSAADAGASADEQPAYGEGDALVEGTNYHATTEVPCGFDDAEPTESCPAGVIRDWGEDGTILVEITKPDGMKRAIFFRGTTPYGADSAEADGSAGWDFSVDRRDDQVTITFGPETYVVVDAFVVGG